MLDLVCNKIGFEGMGLIAKIDCKLMRKINVSGNPAGNKGIKMLCKGDWPLLEEFYLH